ncbi:MAG: TonB-dependent receptor [Candidatus Azobacteroides sp.]|nr:TonB-dependent receptor [Candidatus Azobacteroides sp.]
MTLLRKNFFTFLLFLCSCGVFSQTTILKGKIVSNLTGQPLERITVRLEEQEEIVMSQFDGTFLFQHPAPGEQTVVILSPETETVFLRTTILSDAENDLGEIRVSLDRRKNLLNESALVLIDEESIGEEDSWNDMNISSLMTNSNDIYLSNSGYNFSAMRFRFRGYDYRYSSTYINGVNFNDAERGGFSFGLIGGLNDATRNRDAVGALQPASFTYGQTGGVVNINTSAGSFAPGGRIGAAYTNRNYKLRGSALYSTGLMSNGWAFSGSLAYRWADEGFVEGTFYNSLGIFFGTEKQFNDHHSLSFTFLGAPT